MIKKQNVQARKTNQRLYPIFRYVRFFARLRSRRRNFLRQSTLLTWLYDRQITAFGNAPRLYSANLTQHMGDFDSIQ